MNIYCVTVMENNENCLSDLKTSSDALFKCKTQLELSQQTCKNKKDFEKCLNKLETSQDSIRRFTEWKCPKTQIIEKYIKFSPTSVPMIVILSICLGFSVIINLFCLIRYIIKSRKTSSTQ